MSELIKTLTQEHKNIFKTLDKLRSLECGTMEFKDSLLISKSILLTHLKKEDDFLYPELNKIALNDSKLKTTLEIFADDMSDISLNTLNFLNNYISTDNYTQFEDEISFLYERLYSRIKREEEVIFPLYDKFLEKNL